MFIKNVMVTGLKTISPDATIIEADRLLKKFNIRHLPVLKDGKLVGMLSDRDIYRAMTVLMGTEDESKRQHIYAHRKVADYMTTPVLTLRATDEVSTLVRIMIDKKVSCVIVVDENSSPLGIVTTEDLLILLFDLLQPKVGPVKALKKMLGLGK